MINNKNDSSENGKPRINPFINPIKKTGCLKRSCANALVEDVVSSKSVPDGVRVTVIKKNELPQNNKMLNKSVTTVNKCKSNADDAGVRSTPSWKRNNASASRHSIPAPRRPLPPSTNKNSERPEKNFSEKATFCRPMNNLFKQEFVYKTLQKNAILHGLVKKLAVAREQEKRQEVWNNFINTLKTKHNCYDFDIRDIFANAEGADSEKSDDDYSRTRLKSCKSLLNNITGPAAYTSPYAYNRDKSKSASTCVRHAYTVTNTKSKCMRTTDHYDHECLNPSINYKCFRSKRILIKRDNNNRSFVMKPRNCATQTSPWIPRQPDRRLTHNELLLEALCSNINSLDMSSLQHTEMITFKRLEKTINDLNKNINAFLNEIRLKRNQKNNKQELVGEITFDGNDTPYMKLRLINVSDMETQRDDDDETSVSTGIQATVTTVPCSVQIKKSVSSKLDVWNSNTANISMTSDNMTKMTMAINTDPLGFLSLLRISFQALRQFLAHMPSFIYNIYVSNEDLIDFAANIHSCSVCGMLFKTPMELRNHVLKHSVRRFRGCSICRDLLSPRRPPVVGLFVCQHCGQRFSSARRCELHQSSCARSRARRQDVSSRLLLLR